MGYFLKTGKNFRNFSGLPGGLHYKRYLATMYQQYTTGDPERRLSKNIDGMRSCQMLAQRNATQYRQ